MKKEFCFFCKFRLFISQLKNHYGVNGERKKFQCSYLEENFVCFSFLWSEKSVCVFHVVFLINFALYPHRSCILLISHNVYRFHIVIKYIEIFAIFSCASIILHFHYFRDNYFFFHLQTFPFNFFFVISSLICSCHTIIAYDYNNRIISILINKIIICYCYAIT